MKPAPHWDSFAVRLTTWQGYALAAGGICARGAAVYWKERFRALATVHAAGDLYAIDRALAEKLRCLAEASLIVAGCTLDAQLPLPPGARTGGVLGCPHLPAKSAAASVSESTPGSTPGSMPDSMPDSMKDACERLPHGFSLYAVPGGPGLAALTEPEATRRVMTNLQALGADAPLPDITRCLASSGLETFLYVADGTGPGARGSLVAASAGSVLTIRLNRAVEPNPSRPVRLDQSVSKR